MGSCCVYAAPLRPHTWLRAAMCGACRSVVAVVLAVGPDADPHMVPLLIVLVAAVPLAGATLLVHSQLAGDNDDTPAAYKALTTASVRQLPGCTGNEQRERGGSGASCWNAWTAEMGRLRE